MTQTASRHLLGQVFPLFKIPVPPALAETLGYTGAERHVAFWWDHAADKLACSDGMLTIIGGSWRAWYQYTNHPCVSPFLQHFQFGSRNTPAQHALWLDRKDSSMKVAPVDGVRRILLVHRRTTRPIRKSPLNDCLSDADPGESLAIAPAAQAAAGGQDPDWKSLRRDLDREWQAVERMLAWLNDRIEEK